MKKLFTFLFLIAVGVVGYSQNFSLSNVHFDHAQGDTLLPEEFVNITYDYRKVGGDIRIGIRTITKPNSGYGNLAISGYSLKKDDIGSGDAKFSFNNGMTVDSVVFEFKDLDWTLLYDTTIAANFTWHKFNVNDFVVHPQSPNVMAFGDSVKFDYSYLTTWKNVEIQSFGMSNGKELVNQIGSSSFVPGNQSGAANGFVRMDTLSTVDEIMFRFRDAITKDTLAEVTKDVYFVFTDDTTRKYSIHNVVCDPPTSSVLNLNERVNISFDYKKPHGDVRIYVSPVVTEGSWNYGNDGSRLYSDTIGSTTSYFVFYDESKIEQLHFKFKSPSGLILHEHYEDVLFTYSADSTIDYAIKDIELNPASPANLSTGDTIKLKFRYTKPFGNVYFYVHPMKNDQVVPGFEVPNLGAFSADSGWVESYIIYDVETEFDQIRIQMQTSLYRLLVEEKVAVDYTYKAIPFAISNVVFNPVSPDTLNFGDQLGLSFTYSNLNEQASVKVTPMAQGAALTGFQSNSVDLLNNSGNVEAFLSFDSETKIEQVKIEILSTTSSVIYEKIVDVEFWYRDLSFNIYDVTFNPTTPGTLYVDDSIKVRFKYQYLEEQASVRIFPMRNGNVIGIYEANGPIAMNDAHGSVDMFVKFASPQTIDQVKIEVKASNQTILKELMLDVNYTIENKPLEISNINFNPVSPAVIDIRDSVLISLNYNNLSENLSLKVTPMFGGAALNDFVTKNNYMITGQQGTGQTYIRFDDETKIDQIKVELVDSENAVVYDNMISVNYEFKFPASSADLIGNERMELFPNPVSDVLSVSYGNRVFKFELLSLSGKLIHTEIGSNGNCYVDVSKLKKGVYLARITANEKQQVEKVIVK